MATAVSFSQEDTQHKDTLVEATMQFGANHCILAATHPLSQYSLMLGSCFRDQMQMSHQEFIVAQQGQTACAPELSHPSGPESQS